MQRPQFQIARSFGSGLSAWGLGWMLMRWSGKRIIGHDGATVGQYAFLRVLPEEDLSMALLTNGGDAGGLSEAVFRPLLKALARVDMPETPLADDSLNERLFRSGDGFSRYTGRFQNMSGVTEITARGGKLALEIKPTGMLASPLKKTPLQLVNRNAARLASGNPLLDRGLWLFHDPGADPAEFIQSGLRMSRRIS